MRLAVLSDVHANLHALDAALALADRSGCDRLVVAGDLVGYGAFPDECVARIAERDAVVVAGNHDLVAVGRLTPEHCGPAARQSLEWTVRRLTDATRTYLYELPLQATPAPGIVVAHGAPGDPEAYVEDRGRAQRELADLRGWLLVLGHTHHPWVLDDQRGTLVRERPGPVRLDPGRRFVLNPGSVGQSRSRAPLVRMAVVDTEERVAWMHALAYDVTAAREALTRAGLPASNYHRPSPSRARRATTRARAWGRARAAHAWRDLTGTRRG